MQTMLREIMKYDFAINELVLFLDTHPYDRKAMEMHEALCNKVKVLKDEYKKKCGPLSSNDAGVSDSWKWIDSPWPWEGEAK